MSSYMVGQLSLTGIHILLALSVYSPLATGQLSLGNAGFMAVGAYVASILTVKLGWPLIPALLAGALAAAVLGIGIGFPALRLHGVYLAMGTIAFGEFIRTFFLTNEALGGALGLRGMTGVTPLLIWVCVVLAVFYFWLLSRSRLGLSMQAVRDDEAAAAMMGIPVTAIKVAAFAVGAFLAGLAGALYAHYMLYIEPGSFSFSFSVEMALFVILGGMETFWGPVLGAVLLTALPELLRFLQDWRYTFFGSVIIVLLIFRPGGILSGRLAKALTPRPRVRTGIAPGKGAATAKEGAAC